MAQQSPGQAPFVAQVPLAGYTTLGLGGPARHFAEAADDTGATIEVSGTVEEKLDGNLVAVALTARSAGAKVLSRARAVVRLP